MRIIYCDSGFSPKEVEFMYASEFEATQNLNIPTSLINFEALKKGDLTRALHRVRPNDRAELGIYRGWMLKPEIYKEFYQALLEKNIRLINAPEQYTFCHYLPENYETIKEFTPLSEFKPLKGNFLVEDFLTELQTFGKGPIIVKDYVKSQKHYWHEACFIPNASDLPNVEKVVNRFIELQDSDFNEGLVFREYEQLAPLDNHSISGMPLTKEFRIYVLFGHLVTAFPYWDEGDYKALSPCFKRFESLIPKVNSAFFTMDIAQKVDDDWIIVELGDGQVAGLPDNANRQEFYAKIKDLIKEGI